ncbi:hypothetical protein LLG96_09750 [bacterium]|nr:hypothetical protein [bacterium]
MTAQKSLLCWVIVLLGMFMLSCSEVKPPVKITQYTDPSNIAGLAVDGNMVYCATKGGLVKWDKSAGEYTLLTTADGLPSNILSDVIIDKGKKLWVSSIQGVGVFDGKTWKCYGTSEGLPSGEVNALSLDNKGGIWAATTKGMASFERGRFRVFKDNEGPVGLDIQCIFFDKGGNIWVGTAEKGVYTKTDKGWRRTGSKNGLTTDAASTIAQSWDNSIWAASWAGMCRWDGFGWQGFKPMLWLGTFKARKLQGTQERLWYFTANGIHAAKGSEWLHYNEADGLISNDVLSGIAVTDDLVYAGTSYGMSVIENSAIENYVIPNTPFGYNCISVTADDKGRIWLGTWETGLNVYNSGSWSQIMGDKPETLASVRSIIFGPDGSMVFNTTNGVVFKDKQGWNIQTRNEGLAGDDIRCGIYDSEGRYWCGTSTGISCLSHGNWDRYRAIHGLPSEDIWSCALDTEGTIWFGTTAGIVSLKDNVITDRTPEIGMDRPDVRSIAVIGDTVYFGTESGKIVTYSKGIWDVYGNRFLNTDKGIYSIASDPSGRLWLGTNGDGVIRIENDKAYKYTREDGLPSNYVRSVIFSDGILWTACLGGAGTIEPVAH